MEGAGPSQPGGGVARKAPGTAPGGVRDARRGRPPPPGRAGGLRDPRPGGALAHRAARPGGAGGHGLRPPGAGAGATTELRGALLDQATLIGVLTTRSKLGHMLLAVRCAPVPGQPTASASTATADARRYGSLITCLLYTSPSPRDS